MANSSLHSSALLRATAIGTVLQIAMVLSGHYVAAIAELFAALGVTISLLAGLLYPMWARTATGSGAAVGGMLAGGICALIGILVSYALGDVEALVIAFGTVSSAITGGVGGAVGRWLWGQAEKST